MKAIFTTAILSVIILAAQTTSARNVWRECGIGGMIFKKTGWAAITSNITWDLGSTATSSNVSSDDLCEGPTASTAKFVHETYANLEEEVAAGEGTHLAAMLGMLGCNSAQQASVVSGLRQNLASQYTRDGFAQLDSSSKAEQFFNSSLALSESANCQIN